MAQSRVQAVGLTTMILRQEWMHDDARESRFLELLGCGGGGHGRGHETSLRRRVPRTAPEDSVHDKILAYMLSKIYDDMCRPNFVKFD